MTSEALELRKLLTSARPTWNGKDVDAVQSKLKRIGVQSIPELLLELKGNSLNESLGSKNEKRFCQSTLMALKKCATHWADRDNDGPRELAKSTTARGKAKPKPRRRGSEPKAIPPTAPLVATLPVSTSGDQAPKHSGSDRPLHDLSDAELWTEYMSEGIAPPSFSRADLITMLQAVRSWRTASPLELSKLCWDFGIKTSAEDSQALLCQRLKNKTWEEWGIPIQRYLGNGDMAGAYELLEHFQELEMMSTDELMILCHKKGLPIEGNVQDVLMKERLKLVATWESLPLAELEMECHRRGLPCPPVALPGACQARGELLRILVQGMHNEALARWLRVMDHHDESGADDELTSAVGDEECLECFVCSECHRWAQTDGEAARVEGHRICDDCAWRIYYEEREKEARRIEADDDEAEVFEWMKAWRASRFPHRQPDEREGSPGSPCSEELLAEQHREIFIFHATESESEATDDVAARQIYQHLERHVQGLKDISSEAESSCGAAWNVIAELPTDASEGEDSPFAPYTEHWNFRQLWRQEPQLAAPPPRKVPLAAPCGAEGGPPALAAPCALSVAELPMAETAAAADTASLHTCFCYASPLAKGLRELNVRAEWEAVSTAEGLNVEVRNCTCESLQEVLLSKNRPEILHIAAHCAPPDEEGEACSLVLESDDGSPHVLPAQHLVELGWWDGIQLLVFLACSSQSLVQRLIQSRGLRRAVCCSAMVLDAATQAFCRSFYRALGAGQALATSFEVAQAAIRHGTNRALCGEAGKFVLLCSDGTDRPSWPLREAPSFPRTLWPCWPRVEDYVGRESFTVSLASLFEHRRAVCLWGDPGSGKTALCLEFCRFFSAPGRRFAQGAFHIHAEPQAGSNRLLSQLLQQLGQPALSGRSLQLMEVVKRVDSLRRPWLLVVDGFTDEIYEILSQLLSETTHLHVLLTARDASHGHWALGYSKVVDLPLPNLDIVESALLLARRARRPFFPRDFCGNGVDPLAEAMKMGPELLWHLKESPVMRKVKGHPGQIVLAAAEVGAELQSLLQHPLVMPDAASAGG